jgi:hypothetical protein
MKKKRLLKYQCMSEKSNTILNGVTIKMVNHATILVRKTYLTTTITANRATATMITTSYQKESLKKVY